MLCCEECGKNYQNKKLITSLTSEMIGNIGITVSEFCQKLENNLNTLEMMRENAIEYQRKYHSYSESEEEKL